MARFGRLASKPKVLDGADFRVAALLSFIHGVHEVTM